MLNIADARAILNLAYNYNEHTGQKIEDMPKVIVKLFAMFPELNSEWHPAYIRHVIGLTIQGA